MSNVLEWNLSNANRRRLFRRRRQGFPRNGFLFGLMALGGTMMGVAVWEEMKYVAAQDSPVADAEGTAASPTLVTSLAAAREENATPFAVLRDVVPSSRTPAESGGMAPPSREAARAESAGGSPDEPPRAGAPSATMPSATAPGTGTSSIVAALEVPGAEAGAVPDSPQSLDEQSGGIPVLAFPRMMMPMPAVRVRAAPQTEATPAAMPTEREPRKAVSPELGRAPSPPKAAHVTPHALTRGTTPAEGGFRVQLASVRTEADGRRLLESLRRTHGRALGLYRLALARADVEGRGTVFRVQAGPIADHQTAASICQELRRRNADCLVILAGAGGRSSS